jgi:hypothetical protein
MSENVWKTRTPDGEEQTVGDLETLKRWASEGRIVTTDYVWNPILGKWCYALEVVELGGIVNPVRGVTSARRGCTASVGILLLGLVGMMWSPMIGAFVAVVGLIMSIWYAVIAIRNKQRAEA